MAQEAFFSIPNMSWFAIGIAAEVAFLGIGVSPTGMAWGSEIGQAMGIIEPFNAAAEVASAGAAPAAPAVASTGVEVLQF